MIDYSFSSNKPLYIGLILVILIILAGLIAAYYSAPTINYV